MECKNFIKKYKNILKRLDNSITDLKVNSDDPVVTSYILSELKEVDKSLNSIKNFDDLIKKCIN
jgi:hypothetical protein